MTTEQTRAKIKQQAADLRAEIEAREQRQREAQAIPPAYLSHSAGFWRVIVQGLPICADKRTAAEAMTATTAHNVKLSPVYWDGDSATWKPREKVTA